MRGKRHPKFRNLVFAVIGSLALATSLWGVLNSTPAQAVTNINTQINFQGKLVNTNGTNIADGNYNLEFKLYTGGAGTAAGDPGGTLQWTETRLNNNTQGVTVTNGIFQVNLGSVTALPSNIWNNSTIWLSINLGNTNTTCTDMTAGQCHGDGEMLPMVRFTASPYAYNADQLDGLDSTGFVQLGQNASAQTDGSTNSSIFINKTASGNLLQLQSSGSDAFTLTNAGDQTFGANANHTLSVAQTASNAAGKSLTVVAGAGGAGASANAGGDLVLQGGAGGGTNGNGGNITIQGGSPAGSGSRGNITLQASGGNVGVGTSGTPSQLLSVGGTTGNLTVDTSGNLVTSGNITIGAGSSLKLTGSTSFPGSPTAGQVYYRTDNKQLYVYENGQWQADRSTATKIVADGSTSQNPERADYVVPAGNTSAQTTINNAINALPSGGGTVYLAEGTYTVDGSIVAKSNVTLAGAGPATIIKIKNSCGCALDAMIIDNWAAVDDHITIRDLTLDGNNDGGNYPIDLEKIGSSSSSVPGAKISGIIVQKFSNGIYISDAYNSSIDNSNFLSVGTAIRVDTTSQYITLSNNNINASSGHGIFSAASHSTISGNTITSNADGIYLTGTGHDFNTVSGNTITSPANDGIHMYQSSNNQVVSNNIYGSSGYGIEIDLSNNDTITGNNASNGLGQGIYVTGNENTVTGNTFSDNAWEGIVLGGANENTVSGNKIYNNGGSAAHDGIYLNSADRNTVSGNDITDTAGTGYAIRLAASSDNNYLVGNRYSGTGASAINDAGVGTIFGAQIDGNNNIVHKSSGISGLFVSNSSSNTNPTLVTQAQGAATADLFQAQDSGGNALLKVGYDGTLSVGRASNNTGQIKFYNAGGSGSIGVQPANPGSSTYTLTLPAETGTLCSTGSVCTGYATASGSANYIQNQNAGQQSSSNFWISGTGRADTSFTTPLLDTATGVALAIGTTNATAINLNQNTVIANNKTLTANGLITIQPASSLTNGQIAENLTASTANATASGTTYGRQTNLTVTGNTTAASNYGTQINVTDSNGSSVANTNYGLDVALGGTNSSQGQIGVNANVSNGVGLKGVSSGAAGASVACMPISGSISVGVCGESSVSSEGIGVVGRSSSGDASPIPGSNVQGSGVVGYNGGAGVTASANNTYVGVNGTTYLTTAASYNSVGVLGQAKGGAGSTVYGGYFTLDSTSGAASGAAIYANTPTYTAASSGNGINAVNVLQAAGGPGQAASATTGVTAGSGAPISLVSGNGGAATGASGSNIGGAGGAVAITSGNGGAATSGTGGNGSAITLTAGNGGNGSATNGNGGGITLVAGSAGAGAGTAGTIGQVLVKNAANSPTAFQVQNTAGSNILAVDTSGNQIVLGKAGGSGIGGKITFNNATNANTISLQSGATGGNLTFTLPTADGGNTDCLKTNGSGTLSFAACGAASGSLQGAYNASTGGTTPEITLDTTRNGLDIQNNGSIASGTSLFAVRNSGAGLGTALFNVDAGGGITVANFAQPAGSTNVNGTAATVALSVTGGTGGNTTGGTAGTTAGAGSAVSLTGGTGGQHTGNGTNEHGGNGGAVTLQGGVGGAYNSNGTGTGGIGGTVTVQAGVGGAVLSTGGNAGAGGSLTLQSGAGGAGDATGSGGSGGSITIQTGAPGTNGGSGTGSYGNLLLQGSGGNVGIGLSGVPAALLSVGGTTGSFQVNTSGTVTAGTWNGTAVDVAHGGTGLTTTTAYGLIAGGTTSTGNFQNIGAGTSGQILLSSGASALPAWSPATAVNTCSDCLIQVPLTTGRNTITPTAASVVALTVNGTSGTAATAVSIVQGGNATALNISGSGTGNLAVAATTNSSANGVSIDVNSSSTSQYALQVTSNNAGITGLYVRADGHVGIQTASPGSVLTVADATSISGSTNVNGTAAASVLSVTGGTGGNTTGGTSSTTAGAGGGLSLTGGVGGQHTGNGTNEHGGNGGAVTLQGGGGGAYNSNGTGTGGTGGTVTLQAGVGGAVLSTGGNAGTGGSLSLQSGAGGAGDATGSGGTGGDITIQAGAPGANGGSGTGSYGNISLQASGGFVGIATSAPTTDLSFGNGAARTINVLQASSGAGNSLTVKAGQGASGANAGGSLVLQAGAQGTSGGTGSVIVKANGTESITAFQIQKSDATVLLDADTTNMRVGINTSAPTADLSFGNGANRTINALQASSGAGNSLTIQAGQGASGANAGGNLILQAGAQGTSGGTGSVIVKANGSDSTTAFQVQQAGGTAVLTADTTNSQLKVQGINSIAALGSELLNQVPPNNNFNNATYWTLGTGWGSASATSVTATNATGTVVATSSDLSVSSGVYYQVTYTISSYSSGTITASIGGVSGQAIAGNSTNETQIILTTGTGALTFTPSGNFNGVLSNVSVKQITIANSVLSVLNSDASTAVEIRSGGSGLSNTFVGVQAGQSDTTGVQNTGVGLGALKRDTSGASNSAFGYGSLAWDTTGGNNSAFGAGSLLATTTGTDNVAVGYAALQSNTIGCANTAVGSQALTVATNTCNNTAIGRLSLASDTTGSTNTGLGAGSLYNTSTGGGNIGIGFQGLRANTTGSNNTGIGNQAGYLDVNNNSWATLGNLTNAAAIGYNSQVQASSSLILGGQGASAVNVGIGTTSPTNTLSVSPDQYDTGTAGTGGASSATVTGSGTTWTSAMIGSEFIFSDGTKQTITAVGSTTSLTLASAVTEAAGQSYRIQLPAFQVTSAGKVGIGTVSPTTTLEVDGSSLFKAAPDSTTAFQIQKSDATQLFVVDSTNSRLYVGNPSGVSGTPVLFFPGNKTTSGNGADPTEVDGAMYFNSGNQSFRCGESGAWTDCAILNIQRAFNIRDEFMSCFVGASIFLGDTGSGWNQNTITAADTFTCATGATISTDHPGVIKMVTTATANRGETLRLQELVLQQDEVYQAGVKTVDTASDTVRIGLHNETTATTAPTTGVYWEVSSTHANSNWWYCYVNATPTATCADSGVASSTANWTSLEIRLTALGTNTSSATWIVNGSSFSVSGVTINTTNNIAPSFTHFTAAAAAKELDLDYMQLRGVTSARR